MNTRQHCFTRMMVLAAAGMVCCAIWRPEMAWLLGLLCLVGAIAHLITGLQAQS
jgi:hypothetical protein